MTLFKGGTIKMGLVTTVMEICNGEERLGSTLCGQVGLSSPGAG